ncbi:MAG: hypothetical protein J5908_01445 [Selenomonas sp.]|nr:hypothetical protein [Selenomonas sp.]
MPEKIANIMQSSGNISVPGIMEEKKFCGQSMPAKWSAMYTVVAQKKYNALATNKDTVHISAPTVLGKRMERNIGDKDVGVTFIKSFYIKIGNQQIGNFIEK